jgi:signal peptidase I
MTYMMLILRKTLGYIGWGLLGCLLLIVIFVMWGNKNGWEFDAVLSGSMEPVFNVGGLVVIQPVDVQTLEIGDAISFKLAGVETPICHRIIDIQTKDGIKYFQTRGDANEEADQNLVPLSSVNGKAIFHIPFVGHLAEFKNLGAAKISLLGNRLSAATLIVLGMGLLFIGLTSKDTLAEILWPGRRRRRDIIKKQNARLQKRRQAFKIR